MKENIHMVFLLNVIIICFNLLNHCLCQSIILVVFVSMSI